MRLDPDATVNDCFTLGEKDVDIMAIEKIRQNYYSYNSQGKALVDMTVNVLQKDLTESEIFQLKTVEIKRRALKLDVSFTRSLLSR